MKAKILLRSSRILIYLAMAVVAHGQSVSPQTPQQAAQPVSLSPAAPLLSQNQSTLQAFRQGQMALFQARQCLIAQGATQAQLAAWQKQNAAAFTARLQFAQSLAVTSYLQPRRTNIRPRIPSNASQTLKDFLAEQAALANASALIHNQVVQAMPTNASQAQISQMQQQETQTFQHQHAADMQLQAQRAQTLSQESAKTLSLSTTSSPANPQPQRSAQNLSPASTTTQN
jgi:hypothetical protein